MEPTTAATVTDIEATAGTAASVLPDAATESATSATLAAESAMDAVDASSEAAGAVDAALSSVAGGLDASNIDSLIGQFSELSIYLMGGSFIIGSLFTVLMLLILDFIRRNKTEEGSK